MPIYAGVNGVKRSISSVDVGVNGAKRHAPEVYVGVNGVKRNVLHVADQIQRIEFRVERLRSATVSSDYSFSNMEDIAKSACSSYGSYSVSSSSLSVYSANNGKGLIVLVTDYAVFADGCEKKYILAQLKNQGKSISVSLDGYLGCAHYGSSYFTGAYIMYYFNESMHSGNFSDSISFSRTYDNSSIDINRYAFEVDAGAVSGSGYHTTQVSLNSLTIDGVSVPCRFADAL